MVLKARYTSIAVGILDVEEIGWVTMNAQTEQVKVTIAVTYSKMGVECKFNKLLMGQKEVAIEGRSIRQCLEDMRAQGWTLGPSRATADFQGIVCEYDFWRPVPIPQSDETSSKVSGHTSAHH